MKNMQREPKESKKKNRFSGHYKVERSEYKPMNIRPFKKIKILSLFTSFVCLFGVSAYPAWAAEGHWYIKRNDTHTQPPIASEYSFIEKYNGYYLDRSHGDNCSEKVIYLTFDAGYENGNVEKILDILKKHNAKATFFVLENLIRRNTDLVVRMFEEGHTVANHTMSHKNMANVTDPAIFDKELKGLEKLCYELTGHEMAKYYRPPEGTFTENNLKIVSEMGYKTVFWSFAYADWDNNKQPSPDASLARLLKHTHNGEILLLHPTSSTNAAILDNYLTELENSGYRFATVEELPDIQGAS